MTTTTSWTWSGRSCCYGAAATVLLRADIRFRRASCGWFRTASRPSPLLRIVAASFPSRKQRLLTTNGRTENESGPRQLIPPRRERRTNAVNYLDRVWNASAVAVAKYFNLSVRPFVRSPRLHVRTYSSYEQETGRAGRGNLLLRRKWRAKKRFFISKTSCLLALYTYAMRQQLVLHNTFIERCLHLSSQDEARTTRSIPADVTTH